MFKSVLITICTTLLLQLAPVGPANATPTNNAAVWSWGGLLVDSYREFAHVRVIFKNSAGVQFNDWNDKNGVHQCPNETWLRIHPIHPRATELARTIYSAGLARKRLHIWFEGIKGICYIKGVEVDI